MTVLPYAERSKRSSVPSSPACPRGRETQPINFVGAFEEPVSGGLTIGRLQEAASRLAEYAEDVEAAYGEHAVRSLLVRVGDRTKKLEGAGEQVTLDELVEAVGAHVGDGARSTS